ncbi:hypothetical protein [Alloyangia pacifica]|uniref:hypothetical protein n=1 Tax=Alloyangia pacifica TaxID=311180 RepID=UPI0031E3BE0F
MSADDRVAMLDSFARALRDIPRWAVSQAFDAWEREERRRPAPGEIVHRARAAVDRFAAELRHRSAQALPPEPERDRATGDQTRAAMEAAGFTPRRLDQVRRHPTARTEAELEAGSPDRVPHWTESADPAGSEMAALERARAENPMIAAARAAQAQKLEAEMLNPEARSAE